MVMEVWNKLAPAHVADVATSGAAIWIVKEDGRIAHAKQVGGHFSPIPEPLNLHPGEFPEGSSHHEGIKFCRIDADIDGTLWAVAKNGTLWKYTGKRQIQSGSAATIEHTPRSHWRQTVATKVIDVAVSTSEVSIVTSDGHLGFFFDVAQSQLTMAMNTSDFTRVGGYGERWALMKFGLLWVQITEHGTFQWVPELGILGIADVSQGIGHRVWVVHSEDGSIAATSSMSSADEINNHLTTGMNFTRFQNTSGFRNIAACRSTEDSGYLAVASKSDGTLWACIAHPDK